MLPKVLCPYGRRLSCGRDRIGISFSSFPCSVFHAFGVIFSPSASSSFKSALVFSYIASSCSLSYFSFLMPLNELLISCTALYGSHFSHYRHILLIFLRYGTGTWCVFRSPSVLPRHRSSPALSRPEFLHRSGGSWRRSSRRLPSLPVFHLCLTLFRSSLSYFRSSHRA